MFSKLIRNATATPGHKEKCYASGQIRTRLARGALGNWGNADNCLRVNEKGFPQGRLSCCDARDEILAVNSVPNCSLNVLRILLKRSSSGLGLWPEASVGTGSISASLS